MKKEKEKKRKQTSIAVIIVAAGTGTRLKSKTPKGFVKLGGKPLFLHSLLTFLRHPAVTEAVVVAPGAFTGAAEKIVTKTGSRKKISVVKGGAERWQSVKNGVAMTDAELVLVHDAARPFVTAKVIDRVLEQAAVYDCAITVTPEVDTLRARSGGLAGGIVDRSTIVRVGTPQMFRRSVLIEAFEIAPSLTPPPTDEAALMQLIGVPVALSRGDPLNFKITAPEDLAIAEAIVAKKN
jgi:2-C-methyl-D-erythritol 4-phosphate cytidylyltransferase